MSIPDLISAGYLPVPAMVFSSVAIPLGYLPVPAMVFSSVAIPLCISGGPHLTYSAFSQSSPTLFWFFMLLDAFSITSVVKGVFISAGFMIVGSSAVTAVNMFLKCSVIMLACYFSELAYIISLPGTMRGFFGILS